MMPVLCIVVWANGPGDEWIAGTSDLLLRTATSDVPGSSTQSNRLDGATNGLPELSLTTNKQRAIDMKRNSQGKGKTFDLWTEEKAPVIVP
jgi:hypothetical protein